MNSFLHDPWPWYVTGPLMGLLIPLLLFTANKHFGVSTSLKDICSITIPTKASYFNYDVKKNRWLIVFVLGIILGGLISRLFMHNPEAIDVAASTRQDLLELGIRDFTSLMPLELFGSDKIFSWTGFLFMMLGGFLVGFGVRYAGGCTSGHGFMGLSLGSIGSLVAVLGFFVGGLIMTHLFFPLIF